MHKNAMKCNETLSKWCKNKHGASKIIDTLETYQWFMAVPHYAYLVLKIPGPKGVITVKGDLKYQTPATRNSIEWHKPSA
jgi:hypothetical protein